MALIVYGTTTANTVTTVNANSDLDTEGNSVDYLVWNSSSEPMKIDVAGENDLVVAVTITNAEVSKHTGITISADVRDSKVVIDAGAALHLTLTTVVADGEADDNTVTFTATGIHSDVGLDGNMIYIARLVVGTTPDLSNLAAAL